MLLWQDWTPSVKRKPNLLRGKRTIWAMSSQISKSKPAALHLNFLASGFSLPFLSPQKQKANAEVLTVPARVRDGGGIKVPFAGSILCVFVCKTTVRGRDKVNIPQIFPPSVCLSCPLTHPSCAAGGEMELSLPSSSPAEQTNTSITHQEANRTGYKQQSLLEFSFTGHGK